MQNIIEMNKLKTLILQKRQKEFSEQLLMKKGFLNDENIYELFITALENRRAMDILFKHGLTPYYAPKDNAGKSLLKTAMYLNKWNMVLYLLKDKRIQSCVEKRQPDNRIQMSCLSFFIVRMDIENLRDKHILSLLMKNSHCHNYAEKFERWPPLQQLISMKFDRHSVNSYKDKLIDKIRFLHIRGFDVLAKNREGLNAIEFAQYKLDKLNMSSGNHDYFIDCLREFTVEYERKILNKSIKVILPTGDVKPRI